MKRSLMALATILPIAGAAYAEPISVTAGGATVTLYGTVDVGLWSQNNAQDTTGTGALGGGTGSATQLRTGGISPSKWGLTGSKDLGNGVKGIFTLEQHINAATGETDQSAGFNTSGFNRQTWVGVTGDFGTVLVGRQFNPAILAYAATDPRGLRESLAGMSPWLATGTFAGSTSFASAFSSNSISYTKDFGPVHASVMYAMAGSVGNTSAGKTSSIGLTYSGPVTVSAGWLSEDQNAAAVFSTQKSVEKTNFGIAAPVGPLSVKLNHFNSKSYNVAGVQTADNKLTGLGFDWAAAPQHNVNVSYYTGKNDMAVNDKADSWIVSDEYAWNASTTIYAQAAFIDAKSGYLGALGVDAAKPIGTQAGKNGTVLNVGIRYNF